MEVLHYISLLLKLSPRKLEPWFILWSFFLLRLSCTSIKWCMKYCCYVWAGAPSHYLELLDKLQKQICGTIRPSSAVSHEPLAHHQNVARLSLFNMYQLVDWFHFLILERALLVILIGCMIFLSPFKILQGCLCQQFLSSHR